MYLSGGFYTRAPEVLFLPKSVSSRFKMDSFWSQKVLATLGETGELNTTLLLNIWILSFKHPFQILLYILNQWVVCVCVYTAYCLDKVTNCVKDLLLCCSGWFRWYMPLCLPQCALSFLTRPSRLSFILYPAIQQRSNPACSVTLEEAQYFSFGLCCGVHRSFSLSTCWIIFLENNRFLFWWNRSP